MMTFSSKGASSMWLDVTPEDDKAVIDRFTAESERVIKKWSCGNASIVEKDAVASFLVQLGAVEITVHPDIQQSSQKQVSIRFHKDPSERAYEEYYDSAPGASKSAVQRRKKEKRKAPIDCDDDEDSDCYDDWAPQSDGGDEDDSQNQDDSEQAPDPPPVGESILSQSGEQHPCPDCHLALSSTWALDLHRLNDCVKSAKDTQQVYNCDQCRKSFCLKIKAISHLRKVHHMTPIAAFEKLAALKSAQRQKKSEKLRMRRSCRNELNMSLRISKRLFMVERADKDPSWRQRKGPRGVQRVNPPRQSRQRRRSGHSSSSARYSKRLCVRLKPLDSDWVESFDSEPIDVDGRKKRECDEVCVVPNVNETKGTDISNGAPKPMCNTDESFQSSGSDKEPLEDSSASVEDEPQESEQGRKTSDSKPIEAYKEEEIQRKGSEEDSYSPPCMPVLEDSEGDNSDNEVERGNFHTREPVGGRNQDASTGSCMESKMTDSMRHSVEKETSEKNLHKTTAQKAIEGSSENFDENEAGESRNRKSKENAEGATICPLCDSQFRTHYALDKHLVKNHSDYKTDYKCSTCDKSFVRKQSFSLHLETHMDVSMREKFSCEVCHKTYMSKKNYNDHMRLHYDETVPFKCTICGKGLGSKRCLTRHINSVHVKEVKYTCDVCGKKFYSTNRIKEHRESHFNETKFKCDECGKGFFRAHQLKRHKKDVHSADRVLCEVCGAAFKTQGNLRHHHISAHPVIFKLKYNIPDPDDTPKERNFKCDECGKAFFREARLNRHKREVHSPDRVLCEVCGSAFKTKRNLAQHHMTAHTDVYNFSCEVCGKKFKRMTHLRVHLKTHKNDPATLPHRCDVCSKSFRCQDKLKAHMNVHYNTVSMAGDACGKSFLTKANLDKNKDTHTSERPNECRICSLCFADLAGLRKHLDVVHNIFSKKISAEAGCSTKDAQGPVAESVPPQMAHVRPPITVSDMHCSEFDDHRKRFYGGNIPPVPDASDAQVVREALLAMMNA